MEKYNLIISGILLLFLILFLFKNTIKDYYKNRLFEKETLMEEIDQKKVIINERKNEFTQIEWYRYCKLNLKGVSRMSISSLITLNEALTEFLPKKETQHEYKIGGKLNTASSQFNDNVLKKQQAYSKSYKQEIAMKEYRMKNGIPKK